MRFAINANLRAAALAVACVLSACATSEPSSDGTGGTTSGSGGTNAGSGGATGGATGTGGVVSGAGGAGKGGETGGGGAAGHIAGTGGQGAAASGGATGQGGSGPGSGGSAGGSAAGHGGSGSGGTTGTGGVLGTGAAKGGSSGTGGIKATGGATGTGGTTGSGGSSVNCTGSLPSGGTTHSGDSQGSAAGLTWQLWMNGSNGTMTTYSTPAFSANWNNSGDFLARIGLSWGSGKAYTSLGTVSADFAETKSGSAGGYSYIGIYGWSVNPCVEWYIVDDSYGNLPFNPGGSMVGTATIDGGTYNIIARSTTGTGGNRCGNVSSWNQIYSMRTSKRTCGTISITDHWNAWAKANQQLGSMLEASILIEAGGGSGSISFPTANVTAQ
jgi:endo-1,4-beta-xylanase